MLTNFDIFATAGANKAVVRDFAANANGSGQIVVSYTTVTDNAKSSGIELLSAGGASAAPTVATCRGEPEHRQRHDDDLSVLGADDGGEPNLTYTWATTGTPPAAVTFSANGTNASKNTRRHLQPSGKLRAPGNHPRSERTERHEQRERDGEPDSDEPRREPLER